MLIASHSHIVWPMLAALAGGAALVMLAASWQRVAGTTLRAPLAWLAAAIAAVAVAAWVGYAHGGESNGGADRFATFLGYAAAVLSCAPHLALMGAKRPQDMAWQWVVVALGGVLMIPACTWYFLSAADTLRLQAAWQWFLWALIASGCVNGLPTRHWPAALLAAAAQTLVLLPYLDVPFVRLPFDQPTAATAFAAWSLALMCAAVAFVFFAPAREAPSGKSEAASLGSPLDGVWLDFRDAFGLVWAWRVADRVNAAAQQANWPLELRWDGFYAKPNEAENKDEAANRRLRLSDLPPEINQQLALNLKTLLRRFVSPAWIAKRLGEDED